MALAQICLCTLLAAGCGSGAGNAGYAGTDGGSGKDTEAGVWADAGANGEETTPDNSENIADHSEGLSGNAAGAAHDTAAGHPSGSTHDTAAGSPSSDTGVAGGSGAGRDTAAGSPSGSAAQNSAGGTSENGSGIAAPSVSGALKVCGTDLCDAAGNPVQLRGISTHGLAWFPDYVNGECFRDFRQNWNMNVIRLALYTAEYGGYCAGGDREQLKSLVRDGIDYAKEQDLYVIVDWHILSDSDPNTRLSDAKEFFSELSAEYRDADHILYEICNEPNGGTGWPEICAYAREVIPVIRANDPDAVILVGTPDWCQSVDEAAAAPLTEYDNVMYTLHFYAATHREELRGRMQAAVDAGLPVFVSEYGICDASGNGTVDEAQADAWVELMDEYNISYVAWNLSNKNETSAILSSGCQKTSGFTEEDLSASGRWLYRVLTEGAN